MHFPSILENADSLESFFVNVSRLHTGDKEFAISIPEEKGKRKVQGVPQSQTTALLRPQEEEKTDKSKQAQTEQTYENH